MRAKRDVNILLLLLATFKMVYFQFLMEESRIIDIKWEPLMFSLFKFLFANLLAANINLIDLPKPLIQIYRPHQPAQRFNFWFALRL
jgi:hypothetical protein